MHTPNPLYQGCNVGDLVISAIARGGERVAFISDDTRWTYRELGAKISQVVQALLDRRVAAMECSQAGEVQAVMLAVAKVRTCVRACVRPAWPCTQRHWAIMPPHHPLAGQVPVRPQRRRGGA